MSVVAQLASFKIPTIKNDENEHYAPGSKGREAVVQTLKSLKSSAPHVIEPVVNGKTFEAKSNSLATHSFTSPSDTKTPLYSFASASPSLVQSAIDSALEYKPQWEQTPWNDRAAIWLKAADLVSGKYRAEIVARTMLGQGKNVWQAEIDAAAELADFLRFSVRYAEELYSQQPPENAPGIWNRTEWRPLDGFVLAISPFNFTAIGGNLVGAPALLGNVVIWKPSPAGAFASQLVHKIFLEAGLPPQVVQFLPAQNGTETEQFVTDVLKRKEFAALHFTGSTKVFKSLWKQIALNIDNYVSYPRVVGETGGKNYHLIHPTAHVKTAVINSIRAAFEFQGQKCSALGRVYVPKSLWENGFKTQLVEETNKITVGPPEEFQHFMGPVIHEESFNKINGYIEKAKAAGGEVIAGGKSDSSKGWYIHPTVIVTKDPQSITMKEEIFGPVMTVYVYEDAELENVIKLVDTTTDYALCGAIFAQDRNAVTYLAHKLRHTAGNFYINDKCTGAVVGQQPFGGSRGSGTNDKAGSINLLFRFVNARSIKENWIEPQDWSYPSNVA